MATELIKKPLSQIQDVREMLMCQQARDQIAMVASKHMSPERMLRLVANAIRTTPKLGQCHPLSLLGAMMQASAYGWEMNTSLGHCYAVPFENRRKGIIEVQLISGWRGMKLLAHRNGIYIDADLHLSDDVHWKYRRGSDPVLEHEPGPMMGEVIHAYAVARFREDPVARQYVVYPREKIESIRDASQNWQSAVKYGKTSSNPWKTHFEAMARKTMVRALFSNLPIAGEMSDAMTLDSEKGIANFTDFALNPEDGLTIDIDPDDMIEPEGNSKPSTRKPVTGGKKAVEDKRASEPDPKPEPEAQKPKPEPIKEPEPAEDEVAAEDDGPTANASEVDYSDHPVYQEVQMVIADGIPSGTIRVGMAAALNALKMTDPGAHRAIEALLEQAESVSVQTDDGDDGFVEA